MGQGGSKKGSFEPATAEDDFVNAVQNRCFDDLPPEEKELLHVILVEKGILKPWSDRSGKTNSGGSGNQTQSGDSENPHSHGYHDTHSRSLSGDRNRNPSTTDQDREPLSTEHDSRSVKRDRASNPSAKDRHTDPLSGDTSINPVTGVAAVKPLTPEEDRATRHISDIHTHEHIITHQQPAPHDVTKIDENQNIPTTDNVNKDPSTISSNTGGDQGYGVTDKKENYSSSDSESEDDVFEYRSDWVTDKQIEEKRKNLNSDTIQEQTGISHGDTIKDPPQKSSNETVVSQASKQNKDKESVKKEPGNTSLQITKSVSFREGTKTSPLSSRSLPLDDDALTPRTFMAKYGVRKKSSESASTKQKPRIQRQTAVDRHRSDELGTVSAVSESRQNKDDNKFKVSAESDSLDAITRPGIYRTHQNLADISQDSTGADNVFWSPPVSPQTSGTGDDKNLHSKKSNKDSELCRSNENTSDSDSSSSTVIHSPRPGETTEKQSSNQSQRSRKDIPEIRIEQETIKNNDAVGNLKSDDQHQTSAQLDEDNAVTEDQASKSKAVPVPTVSHSPPQSTKSKSRPKSLPYNLSSTSLDSFERSPRSLLDMFRRKRDGSKGKSPRTSSRDVSSKSSGKANDSKVKSPRSSSHDSDSKGSKRFKVKSPRSSSIEFGSLRSQKGKPPTHPNNEYTYVSPNITLRGMSYSDDVRKSRESATSPNILVPSVSIDTEDNLNSDNDEMNEDASNPDTDKEATLNNGTSKDNPLDPDTNTKTESVASVNNPNKEKATTPVTSTGAADLSLNSSAEPNNNSTKKPGLDCETTMSLRTSTEQENTITVKTGVEIEKPVIFTQSSSESGHLKFSSSDMDSLPSSSDSEGGKGGNIRPANRPSYSTVSRNKPKEVKRQNPAKKPSTGKSSHVSSDSSDNPLKESLKKIKSADQATSNRESSLGNEMEDDAPQSYKVPMDQLPREEDLNHTNVSAKSPRITYESSLSDTSEVSLDLSPKGNISKHDASKQDSDNTDPETTSPLVRPSAPSPRKQRRSFRRSKLAIPDSSSSDEDSSVTAPLPPPKLYQNSSSGEEEGAFKPAARDNDETDKTTSNKDYTVSIQLDKDIEVDPVKPPSTDHKDAMLQSSQLVENEEDHESEASMTPSTKKPHQKTDILDNEVEEEVGNAVIQTGAEGQENRTKQMPKELPDPKLDADRSVVDDNMDLYATVDLTKKKRKEQEESNTVNDSNRYGDSVAPKETTNTADSPPENTHRESDFDGYASIKPIEAESATKAQSGPPTKAYKIESPYEEVEFLPSPSTTGEPSQSPKVSTVDQASSSNVPSTRQSTSDKSAMDYTYTKPKQQTKAKKKKSSCFDFMNKKNKKSAQSSKSQSQTGQSQTRQSQAGQSQTGQSQAGQSQAGQSQAGQSQARQSQTRQSQAGQSQAGPRQTGQSQVDLRDKEIQGVTQDTNDLEEQGKVNQSSSAVSQQNKLDSGQGHEVSEEIENLEQMHEDNQPTSTDSDSNSEGSSRSQEQETVEEQHDDNNSTAKTTARQRNKVRSEQGLNTQPPLLYKPTKRKAPRPPGPPPRPPPPQRKPQEDSTQTSAVASTQNDGDVFTNIHHFEPVPVKENPAPKPEQWVTLINAETSSTSQILDEKEREIEHEQEQEPMGEGEQVDSINNATSKPAMIDAQTLQVRKGPVMIDAQTLEVKPTCEEVYEEPIVSQMVSQPLGNHGNRHWQSNTSNRIEPERDVTKERSLEVQPKNRLSKAQLKALQKRTASPDQLSDSDQSHASMDSTCSAGLFEHVAKMGRIVDSQQPPTVTPKVLFRPSVQGSEHLAVPMTDKENMPVKLRMEPQSSAAPATELGIPRRTEEERLRNKQRQREFQRRTSESSVASSAAQDMDTDADRWNRRKSREERKRAKRAQKMGEPDSAARSLQEARSQRWRRSQPQSEESSTTDAVMGRNMRAAPKHRSRTTSGASSVLSQASSQRAQELLGQLENGRDAADEQRALKAEAQDLISQAYNDAAKRHEQENARAADLLNRAFPLAKSSSNPDLQADRNSNPSSLDKLYSAGHIPPPPRAAQRSAWGASPGAVGPSMTTAEREKLLSAIRGELNIMKPPAGGH